MTGAAVHDPKRHFFVTNCCIANGSLITSSARASSFWWNRNLSKLVDRLVIED